ncbi:MAG: hypothetical protein FVQ83_03925 [Chloroflexi bacterium]|nr:hypothetical protein [Chloroflexota bacterium]
MVENKNRSIIPSENDPGFTENLILQLRLVLKLLADSRVIFLLKLLPLASLIYLIIPDLILGPFDDAFVLGIGLYLFVELCPSEIVEEHRAALRGKDSENGPKSEDVIDAEFD